MEEPSVLDLVKEKLAFWRKRPPQPAEVVEMQEEPATIIHESISDLSTEEPSVRMEGSEHSKSLSENTAKIAYRFPWRILLAVVLGLIGQRFLTPEARNVTGGVFFYGMAVLFGIWGIFSREWQLAELPGDEFSGEPSKVRRFMLALGAVVSGLAFLALGGNQFTFLNVVLWLIAVTLIVLAFVDTRPGNNIQTILKRWGNRARLPWLIKLEGFDLLFILAVIIILFFRLYHLNQVPAEMISDHAEKLLDIGDVLSGKFSIFFPRNTGREAFQMYWTALMIKIFGTGLSFLSLKIGAAIAGLFTLPFIYLLGKEMGSRWAGLAGMLLGGIAYWPNVFTRIALRFTYYPAFTAPALFYFMRGLRRSNRNDMIKAGIFLGIGLHGYTPMRIVPFLIVLIALLFVISRIKERKLGTTVINVTIVALVSAAVLLPLLRFTAEYPQLVSLRAFSRLGDASNPLPGSGIMIFLQNFWKASIMFFWSGGEIWPHSVPYYPALDSVMAVLYLLGTVLLLVRFAQKRNWQDISLLVSVPMLMMPSILSLAYPAENPSLNRTAAAFIPVALIAGLAFEALIKGIFRPAEGGRGKWLAIVVTIILLALTLGQNFNLVFDKYARQYQLSAWNTSEIGAVIRQFTDTIGESDSAYVVGWPYWVDTRLVAYNAGFPGKDFAIWPDQFDQTLAANGAKLFIINIQDTDSIEKLTALYPSGSLSLHKSPVEGKDFYVFVVPPQTAAQP